MSEHMGRALARLSRILNGEQRETIRDSLISFAFKAGGAIASFLMTMLISNSLGLEQSGIFFLSLSIVTFLAAISRLGFDQVVLRYVSNAASKSDWDSIKSFHRRSFAVVLVASTLLSIVTYLNSDWVSRYVLDTPELSDSLRLMSLSIVGFMAIWFHSFFFQAVRSFRWFQWFQNFGIFATFAFAAAAMVWLGEPTDVTLPSFAKLFTIISCLCGFWAYAMWGRLLKAKSPSLVRETETLDWSSLHILLTPFMGLLLLQQAGFVLPHALLASLGSPKEVAYFAIASKVATIVNMVLIGVNSVLFPKFSSLHSDGKLEELRHLSQWWARATVVIILPIVTLAFFYSNAIMNVFGDEFSSGGLVLKILLLGQLVNIATGSVGGLLNMTGFQRDAFWCGLFGFSSMAATLLFIVPHYGASGAAFAYLLSIAIHMGGMSFACKKRLGFMPVSGLFVVRPNSTIA